MKHLLVCLFLVLTFRTFQFFPLFAFIQEMYFLVGMIVLAVAFLRHRKQTEIAKLPFFRYVMLLVFITPLWSAYAALLEHGQPILFGVLSMRGVGLLAGSVGLLYLVRIGKLSPSDIEKAFVSLTWFTFCLYVFMRTFLEPGDYVHYGKGFIEDRGSEGLRFNFSMTFIIFGVFYYALKAFRKQRPSLYLPSILLYLFVLGDAGGRILTISMIFTISFFVFRWSNARHLIRVVLVAIACVVATSALLSVAAPEATANRLDRFKDAFAVVLLGTEVDDPSANSRALQVAIALPLVEKNLWIGNGNISYKWIDDSTAGLLGVYFYPADIGLIGVIYLYGVLGLCLLVLQYVYAVKEARKTSTDKWQTFKDAVNGFLCFTAVSSIATGYFCHYPEVVCTMIFCLIAINSPRLITQQKHYLARPKPFDQPPRRYASN